MELEITWNRAIRVWWSYFCRSFIAMLIGMIIGMIEGATIGFVMGSIGFSIVAIQIVVVPISLITGLGISIVPTKMILGKDFGEFRLVLFAEQPAEPEAIQ